MTDIRVLSKATSNEIQRREDFAKLLAQAPLPPIELLQNLGLFINRQSLSRILFLNEIFAQIVPVHGVVMEFGVRWGQSLAIYESLRGIYEPYNYNRKIIGFDTFSGFPSVHEKDGRDDIIREGAFGVTDEYRLYLEKILDYHEQESPLSHIKKYELIQGDAAITLKDYLSRNPQTIVSLAYFDFDIYEPTVECLKLLLPFLTKGAVVGFDELNHPSFPGETVALREVLGTNNVSIRRSKYSGYYSYIVYE